MKPRPPTMREKRRYILVRLVPEIPADPKVLYTTLLDSVTSIFGDLGAARIHMAVVYSAGPYAILRCRRGMEQDLMIALSTVCAVGSRRLVVRTQKISGTIRSLKEKIPPDQESCDEDISINGESCHVSHRHGVKIDLFEKGFKNRELLFLTTMDIEETECNHNTRWDTTGQ
ncbi:MAG: Rpp14/Pop5 family protein [Methanoregulaceae archaeon]|nr:Rpp14/Pop5 family protein [Methanoregulaceae archaeon]